MQKKTNKELTQAIDNLGIGLNNLASAFQAYMIYKGDDADFRKHLIDLQEKARKEKEDDTKATDK
tara:strand:- start:1398 stop:1592 length:195 start_codon:yes stop_codon:yes gene_type:complete